MAKEHYLVADEYALANGGRVVLVPVSMNRALNQREREMMAKSQGWKIPDAATLEQWAKENG